MSTDGGLGARAPGVGDIRRARIVEAVVDVVCERGFAGVSVASVCARAGVSRQAFYETFDSREDCCLAVLDEGHRRVSGVVSAAFAGVDWWLDGVRAALAELLLFFDAEPGLARVCVVESLAAAPWALERREGHVAALTRQIVEHWGELAPPEPYPFANLGVTISVLGVIQNRLSAPKTEPLIDLLGPLMGQVTAPYLNAQDVAREIERSSELARAMRARQSSRKSTAGELRVRVPGVLLSSRAHHARLCLRYLAEHPGASNQRVAASIGVSHRGQLSRLLVRLTGLGLLVKRSGGPGRPNAWSLSDAGKQVAQALAEYA